MKVPPLRALAAAVLAVTLVLSGPAAPAHAARTQANPNGPNTSLLEMLDFALDVLSQAGDGDVSPEDLAVLTQRVIDALNQAESAVIAHLDAIAVADLRSNATHAVVEFEDINNLSEDVLWDWAQKVSGDALRATEYLDVVSAGKAVDDVGYAVVTMFPIALVARARAGLGTTNLRNQFRAAAQKIADKLAPTCRDHYPEPNSIPLIRAYTCTVYGPHTVTQLEQNWLGHWQLGPIDEAAVHAASYANTSRAVAVEWLRQLP
ncbi:hypothetical protein [Plantactinospora endophytica]|uniref:Uncharacterized protein n=1 Tax=Plantactinospora endophytica TaxID=673535 RepID=A0ABQ4DSJ2_9ACTN|nr:hypothetical protein [Plantactinospora endophytica]GIG85419.1 hypothetical protein Pen02_03550 [Plantactinospora endophytica]